jgi:hypothetical protein
MNEKSAFPYIAGWKRTPLIAGVAAILLVVAGVLLAVVSERGYQAS